MFKNNKEKYKDKASIKNVVYKISNFKEINGTYIK